MLITAIVISSLFAFLYFGILFFDAKKARQEAIDKIGKISKIDE
jgi:hypothetical protein